MKIIFLTVNIAQIGGIERSVINICNYMVENYNYEIEIVSVFSSLRRSDISFEVDKRVKTTFLDNEGLKSKDIINRIKFELGNSKRLIEYVNKSNANICIITHNIFNPLIKVLKINSNCKFIFCEHATHKQYSKGRNILNILTYASADKLIVLSADDANFYKKYIKNVHVIFNPKFLKCDKKANLKNKKIISVGRLTYVKGFDRLIEAFALIAHKHKDWELNIFGCGEEQKNLVIKINKLNLGRQIKVVPFTTEIEKFYLESSIYALPSRDESFGMVLLEAMEMGLPCIAFESFGPKEIIGSDKNGILVKNDDIVEFSNKLEVLMSDEELRHKIVNNASKNIEKYDITKIAEEWRTLINSFN